MKRNYYLGGGMWLMLATPREVSMENSPYHIGTLKWSSSNIGVVDADRPPTLAQNGWTVDETFIQAYYHGVRPGQNGEKGADLVAK